MTDIIVPAGRNHMYGAVNLEIPLSCISDRVLIAETGKVLGLWNFLWAKDFDIDSNLITDVFGIFSCGTEYEPLAEEIRRRAKAGSIDCGLTIRIIETIKAAYPSKDLCERDVLTNCAAAFNRGIEALLEIANSTNNLAPSAPVNQRRIKPAGLDA